eukprot:4433150-Alexandrium_andersonii.AAC.1
MRSAVVEEVGGNRHRPQWFSDETVHQLNRATCMHRAWLQAKRSLREAYARYALRAWWLVMCLCREGDGQHLDFDGCGFCNVCFVRAAGAREAA